MSTPVLSDRARQEADWWQSPMMGSTTSRPMDATDQPTLTPQPPAPSIYGPAPGGAYSTYLQYSTVTLDGTARDAEDGVLPGLAVDLVRHAARGSRAKRRNWYFGAV